jgi:hypothetical protein
MRRPRGLPGLVVVLVVPFLSTTTAHAGVVQAPASAGSGDFAGLVDSGASAYTQDRPFLRNTRRDCGY